ncbi:MAG: hypothetical protein IKH26_00145 [Bacteroidaceae bacterium]|nr:hypothetical protein [Bacteroidaceae bacterium]
MKKFLLTAAVALAVSCGNVQKYPEQPENDSTVVALTDTVKPEVAPTANNPELDAKVESIIREFYNDCIWGDKYYSADSMEEQKAILSRYCTKGLIEWLAEDNPYDVPCYAIWDFRSDAQDSNGENEIYSVEPLGGGKYKVSFNDGGTKGSCVLSVVVDGGNIKFDEISDRYSEE